MTVKGWTVIKALDTFRTVPWIITIKLIKFVVSLKDTKDCLELL